MTAPNIVDVAAIKGFSSMANALTTSAQTLIENPVSSNNVIKLNNVVISNIDGTNNADITLILNRAGAASYIAKNITVPADSALPLITKEYSLYLQEGDSIQAFASASGDLAVSGSYEIISEQTISVANGNSIIVTLAATDPYFANVSLLLHGDGTSGSTTITDSSSYGQVLTPAGNIQISTSVKKYGTGSIAFDGTGDYALDTTPVAVSPGTGDFTVEYWIYPAAVTVAQYVFDMRSSATGRWAIYYGAGGTNQWSFYNGSSIYNTAVALTLNTWQHVAWTRSGTTLRLFVDGVQQWSTTDSSNMQADWFNLGRRYSNAEFLNGYLDDFRLTIGVARYTTGFTPPTEAFPDS